LIRHSHETMVEALRLVGEGRTHSEAATRVGVLKTNVDNWVRTFRKTGRYPTMNPGRPRGGQSMGYIPTVRAGVENYELLSPEAMAEFLRRQEARAFEVIESEG
jgi:hypothetical protein